MSRVMRKPAFCICENKDADQLHGNREADQRLCFRYTDSTIRLLPKSEFSSFSPSSVALQPGLCRTWLETPKTGFLATRLKSLSTNDYSNILDVQKCHSHHDLLVLPLRSCLISLDARFVVNLLTISSAVWSYEFTLFTSTPHCNEIKDKFLSTHKLQECSKNANIQHGRTLEAHILISPAIR